jgi:ABC-type multidrug transport system permease subunit
MTGVSEIITAATFGCFMTALWLTAAFRGGWILSQAHEVGALEIEMTTRSSLASIIFGRLVAIIVLYSVVASLLAIVVVLFGGRNFEVGSPSLLLLSTPFALLSIVACAYILIPLSFLTGGLPGFFNAILPGVVLVSGFLQPTNLLPAAVKVIGLCFGTTWAMDAIRQSLQRDANTRSVSVSLLLSLLISALYLAVSKGLIGIAERKMRQGRYSSFNER